MNQNNKRIHMGRLLKTGQRLVAMGLVAAMTLPTCLAATTSVLLTPPQVERLPDGTSPEDPKIQIEGNFVRDEFGFLTDTFELALRVKAPSIETVDEKGDPAQDIRAFRTLSVSLAYDTSFLHPVSWEWVKGADTNNVYDIEMDAEEYYDVAIPTQKDEWVTTAAAQSGIVTYTDSSTAVVTDDVRDGKLGLLHFTATSYKENELKDMTTVAVIRFSVSEEVMEKIEIKKNALLKGGYEVRYDGTAVSDMAALQAAMGTPVQVANFATYQDISASKSLTEMALYYSDIETELGYITDFDPVNPQVTPVKVDVAGTTITVDKPDTPNTPSQDALILAEKDGNYSYLTNLISKENISFPIVSDLSFVAGGTDLDKLTTIVYVDWDNKLLGTQIVPKRADVRQLVSDYVAEEFVHEDLRTPTAANIDSIKRTDSYRGRYPYSGPGGASTEIITDGENWPLTYKLDYTFFKRPMTHPGEKPDPKDLTKYPAGELDSQYIADLKAWEDSDSWVQVTGSATGDVGAAAPGEPEYMEAVQYPFAYGWAQCTVDNYEDVWTTMGSLGELTNYTVDANGVATVDYDGTEDFKFADLEKGFTESTVFLKAIYEPGDENEYSQLGSYMSDPDAVRYIRYGYVGSETKGSAYSIQYQYERVEEGTGRGVRRARDPAVRLEYTFDEEGSEGKTFYLKINVSSNSDIMDVEYTPPGTMYALNYVLVDQYGNTFATGEDRALFGNEEEILGNFEYENYSYGDRKGSDGFVYEATLRQLMVTGAAAVKPTATVEETQEYESLVEEFLLGDLNLKFGSTEFGDQVMDFTGNLTYVNLAKTKLLELFKAAYAAGEVTSKYDYASGKWQEELTLDWHQLQYHILKSDINGAGGAVNGSTVYSSSDCITMYGDFSWCHRHNGGTCSGGTAPGGTENPVTNWSELLFAAYDSNTNAKSLNGLKAVNVNGDPFYLRQADGAEYSSADLATLKVALKDAVNEANTLGGSDTAYQSLTWGQVQYYLLNGAFPATLTDADTTAEENYWWVKDGAKATDLPTTLAAAERAADTAFKTPDGVTHNGWSANLKTITSDMDKVSDAPLRLRESKDTDPYDGTPYQSAADFEAAIKALVTKAKAAAPTGWDDANTGLGNWDILQYYLIHSGKAYDPTADDADIKAEAPNYWWRYGNQVKNWDTLMEAMDTYIDGTDPDAKLIQAVAADLLTDNTAGIWLRKDENGTLFTAGDMTTFVNAMKAIADAMDGAGKTMAADGVWDEVQYMVEEYVKNGSVTYPVNTTTVQDRVDNYYWWKNGGTGVIDFATLIQAASEAYGTDGTDGKGAMLHSLQKGSDVPGDLKKSFDGTAYDDADIPGLKTTLKQMIADAQAGGVTVTGTTWNPVQYYLLHGNFAGGNNPTINGETNTYYWWKDGGTSTGNPVSMSVPSDPEGVANLLKAAFNSGINGDSDGWGALTDANLNGILSDTTTSHFLYPAYAGTEVRRSEFAAFGTGSYDKAYFVNMMDTLAKNAVANGFAQDNLPYYTASDKTIHLDWYQIQYALLNGGALLDPTSQTYTDVKDEDNGYWWLKKDEKASTVAPTATTMDAMLDEFENYYAGNLTQAQLKNKFAITWFKNDMGLRSTIAGANALLITNARNRLATIADAAKNTPDAYKQGHVNLTWYQLQYYMYNGTPATKPLNACTAPLISPQDAYDHYINNYTGAENRPQWVQDLGTAGPGVTEYPTRVLSDGTWMDNWGTQPASFALRLPMMMAPMETAPVVTEESKTSEDGLTETTTTTTKTYNEETGDWDTRIVTVVVTKVAAGETTIIVTTTTVTESGIDLETGEYVTKTFTTTETQTVAAEPAPEEAETPAPTETMKPEETPEPDETQKPGESPEPTETQKPVETDDPVESEKPAETPEPAETEDPVETQEPPESQEPEESPAPAETENPSETEGSTAPSESHPDGEEEDPSSADVDTETTGANNNIEAEGDTRPVFEATDQTASTGEEDPSSDALTSGIIALTQLLEQDAAPARLRAANIPLAQRTLRLQDALLGKRLYTGRNSQGTDVRISDMERWRSWLPDPDGTTCVYALPEGTGKNLKLVSFIMEHNGRKLT